MNLEFLGEHSHDLLPLILHQKVKNMNLLCTVETMEEFEQIKRKHGCTFERSQARKIENRTQIKPGSEKFTTYRCKFRKNADLLGQSLPGRCPFNMLPIPDNEQKGKIRIYIQGLVSRPCFKVSVNFIAKLHQLINRKQINNVRELT